MGRLTAWIGACVVAALVIGAAASQLDAQPFPAQDSLQVRALCDSVRVHGGAGRLARGRCRHADWQSVDPCCALQAAAAGVSIGSFENATNAASWHRKLQQVCLISQQTMPISALEPACGSTVIAMAAQKPTTMKLLLMCSVLTQYCMSKRIMCSDNGCCPCPQLPKSAAAQMFLDGVLQEAKLDASCADQPTCGGSLVVNGISVVVPKNAMVFFPANALTWQEMFTSGSSGLAASDKPAGGPYIVRWAHIAAC